MKNRILYILLAIFLLISNNAISQNIKLADLLKFNKMSYPNLINYVNEKGYELFTDLQKEKGDEKIEFNLKNKGLTNFSILRFKRNLPLKFQVTGDLPDTLAFSKMISDAKKQGFNIVNVRTQSYLTPSMEIFAVTENCFIIEMKNKEQELWVTLTTKNLMIPYISLPDGARSEKLQIKYSYEFLYFINYNLNK